MTTTNVTAAQARSGLIDPSGARWAGNITYSIPGAGALWVGGYGTGEPSDPQYGTLDATQATSFRAAMELWDSYIAPLMDEIPDSVTGDIRVAFTDVTARTEPDAAAYAYGPVTGSTTPPQAGDIWIDENDKSSTFAPRTQDFELLLHEAGHSLGLKHPFDAPTLPAGYESKTYSVMSYATEDYLYVWYGSGGGYGYTVRPTLDFTPMVLDILAIQEHYGADSATNAGNTVHAFSDADLNGRQAIYDAGGVDTLDISALSRGSNVDLRAGAYSDLAYYNVEDQIRDVSAIHSPGNDSFIRQEMTNPNQPAYEWERNLGLSFSTLIENVVGSAKADTIAGNEAANLLDGRGGIDVLVGLGANDVYVVDNAGDIVDESVAGSTGVDTVKSSVISIDLSNTTRFKGDIERITLESTGAINATGNALNNLITGNSGANLIDGKVGGDVMRGVGGNDTYVIDNANDIVDETLAGSNGVDTIKSSIISVNLSNTARYVGVIERVTLEGGGAINATGNGLNNLITGNSGANTIDGKVGGDVMRGVGGNDVYVIDNANDIVDEALAGSNGVDTIKSSTISFDLSNTARYVGAVERATLEGGAAINATGNGLNNLITGNSGANRIEGRGGADILIGLAGGDTFVYRSAADSGLGALRDTINDFEDVGDNDTLDLSGFAGVLSYIGTAAFTAANQVRATQSGVHVLVEINTVGTTGAESHILLASTTIGQIDVGDFIV